jgi:hypothetical protein
LDLRARFLLTGIELVSHESMIADRVDLYSTRQEALGEAPEWDSIGYFRLHSNERSRWTARELKRIVIDQRVTSFLRLTIAGCHYSPLNPTNRCCFITFKLRGAHEIRPVLTSYDDMFRHLLQLRIARTSPFPGSASSSMILASIDARHQMVSLSNENSMTVFKSGRCRFRFLELK